MKRIFLVTLTLISLAAVLSYADLTASYFPQPTQQNANAMSFPSVNWISKNANDEVIIHNGNGGTLVIQVTVDGPGPYSAGVTIKNCGSTISIKAGGTAICTSSDPVNPVSFSSDSNQHHASGTYQVKQK